MKLNRYAIPAFVLFLGTAGLFTVRSYAAPANPASPAVSQDRDDRGWDMPPQELNEIQRRGFHDGIEGARKDYGNHRQPDVNNREEYLHPHLPREEREAYREGFRRGYRAGVRHLWGGQFRDYDDHDTRPSLIPSCTDSETRPISRVFLF